MSFFGPVITINNKKIKKIEKKFGCKYHPVIGFWVSGMKYCPICGKQMDIFERTFEEYANSKDIFGTFLHHLKIHNCAGEQMLFLCDTLEHETQTAKNGYSNITKNINTKKMIKEFMKKYKKGIKFLNEHEFKYSIDIALVKEICSED